MMRRMNKGVSMVEVLIALAVFMVMMLPLVTSLTTGIRTASGAKETQVRDEYAQNLLEDIKEIPIDVLSGGTATAVPYFTKKGSTDVAIDTSTASASYSNWDGTTIDCPYETYAISGKTYFGTDHTKYSYLIEVSNKDYAEAQAAGTNTDPNNRTSAMVENLDQSKVALISATMSNYDTAAYDVMLAKKLAELRKYYEKKSLTFDPATAVNQFSGDLGRREIEIAVKGKESDGYDVTCTLHYTDGCSLASSVDGKSIREVVGNLEYVVYSKHFKTLPNIYLMYNMGVYNNKYMLDYITYNLSGLTYENKDVNIFVMETAAKYSADVQDEIETSGGYSSEITAANDRVKTGSSYLYRNAVSGTRDSIKVSMAVLNSSLSEGKREHLHIYHNILAPAKKDYASTAEYTAALTEWNKHKKSNRIAYDDAAATEVKTWFGSTTRKYEKVRHVDNLNSALSDLRGLYTVTVWMQQGDVTAAALKTTSPVLQGTKGGGEVD